MSISALPVFKRHRRRRQEEATAQTRRRRAIILLSCIALWQQNQRKSYGRPYAIEEKKRKNFWHVVKRCSAKDFKTRYRLTCAQFRHLVSVLRPTLDRNKHMAERSSGSIQAEVKVALMLRILAGASHHDLCQIFDIPPSSVYDLFHRTMNAMTLHFSLPGIPEEEDKLKDLAFRFKVSRRGGSPLNGCIGALDGIAIKIQKPHKDYHPALYYCRKHFYAVPAQVMVDADYRIRCLSVLCVGATHDSLAHSISYLGRFLRDGKLRRPFWIAANEAYICTELLLTPFAASQFDRSTLSKYKDSFNYFHSSLRMHVEQAFGQLVARFGILWRPLRFSLRTCTKVLLVVSLLHNFCIDNSNRKETWSMSYSERKKHKRAFVLWYRQSQRVVMQQCNRVLDRNSRQDRAMQKSINRREMVNLLKSLRLERPYGQGRFDSEPQGSCT